MTFTYKCWECPREIVSEDLCKLVICLVCMCEMELVKIGKTNIQEGMIIQ